MQKSFDYIMNYLNRRYKYSQTRKNHSEMQGCVIVRGV